MNFLGLSNETLILLIPVAIALILILVVLIARGKTGLAIGILATGLLGFLFLKKRRLQEAFDIEDKLAKNNEKFDEFKKRQKERYQAITANKEILLQLKEKLEQLKKKPAENRLEIQLLEKEIQEREALNEKLLSEDSEFFAGEETAAIPNEESLKVYDLEEEKAKPKPPASGKVEIEVGGHRLFEA